MCIHVLLLSAIKQYSEKARAIYLYRNGDKMHDGERVIIKASYRNMQQVRRLDLTFQARISSCLAKLLSKSNHFHLPFFLIYKRIK